MSFGVLNGDRTAWIPASVNRHGEAGPQRFEIAVDLTDGQLFWIVVSNQHPQGGGVSNFIIHRLDGSEEASVLLADREPMRRPSPRRRGWRRWAAISADDAGKRIAALLGRRQTYRVAGASPEFQAVGERLSHRRRTAPRTRPPSPSWRFQQVPADRRPNNLHVNGCGDFQLMARSTGQNCADTLNSRHSQ